MSSSREKGKRSSVPKFTSFKPKTPDVTQNLADTTVASSSRSTSHSSRTLQQTNDRKLDGNALYYVDKRGDDLITRYGSNDRRSIPEYRRIGSGRILGADGFMRIEKLGSREEFFIYKSHETRSILSSDKKSLRERGFRPHSQSIRIRRRKSETGVATEDYLPLKTSKKQKQDGAVDGETSGEEGPSYRSIHGKSKKHEHSDSDEMFDSDASEGAQNGDRNDPVAMRSIDLSRRVQEHPEDVLSWLELVDHQDTLLRLQSGARAPTLAEVKSFADIKLSLLEQALSHVSDDALRERLSLKIITEGVKVWESKTASKMFAEIMQKYPKSFELWKLYVSFLQSDISTCRYDVTKQLYTEKLKSLGHQLLDLDTVSVSDQIDCSEQIIYVFLRLTRFLEDAGFVELASAAWQASLELNLARPSTLPQTGWGIPSSFQDYWESEIPRLGEDDWRGWVAFAADGGAQEPPNPKTSISSVTPDTRDGYKAWHIVEQDRAQTATVPARTLDDGAEADPFRVVMFTDLQDILLYFPTEIIPHVRSQLLDAFLLFCHLPPTRQFEGLMHEAIEDPFIVRSVQSVPFTHLSARHDALEPEAQQPRPPEFFSDIQYISLTPEVLFPSSQWFRYLEQIREKVPLDRYRWVSTTLRQLTRVVGAVELGPYALAFESINEPGSEKKCAKALLKQDPFNVDLYVGYSILEHERGNKAAARNVLSAALGLPSISAHDRVRLGIGATWLELSDGELTKAVLQLCRLAEDVIKLNSLQTFEATEVTPSQILKARQFLVTNRDYKISTGEIAQAVIYAEGLVLLEYLTQQSEKEPRSHKQGDIWSAIQSITQCSEDLVSRHHQHNPSHERFLQCAARVLYYHASHGSFRPSLLRAQLTQYLTYFPTNTIFLTLFAWRQERLSINDPVRTLLQDTILVTQSSLSSHIFAISHELKTGNAHSTRASFERALSSSDLNHHPGLWIAYIRFCHARRELRPKARDVFYRAVAACPWSKHVFMEAFGTLGRDLDSAELRGVYATLCDKGLRVHVDMDEFVESWRGGKVREGRNKIR